MPRPLRKCLPDKTYSCTSRCIEIRQLLDSNNVKKMIIKAILMAQEKYIFKLNYMKIHDNSIVLIIHTESCGETISRIMQFIKARIAENYNKMYKRTGPFWNERFKSKIIEEYEYPVEDYIHEICSHEFRDIQTLNQFCNKDIYNTYMVYIDINYIPKVRICINDLFIKTGSDFKERARKLREYEKKYLLKCEPRGLIQ
jgi:putative transposase